MQRVGGAHLLESVRAASCGAQAPLIPRMVDIPVADYRVSIGQMIDPSSAICGWCRGFVRYQEFEQPRSARHGAHPRAEPRRRFSHSARQPS
jgi:hypothetical protein